MGAYKAKTHSKRRLAIKLLIVVIILLVAGVSYLWLLHRSDKNARYTSLYTTIIGRQAAPVSKPKAKLTSAITTVTKQYTSVNQGLTLNYPANWSVNETTDVLTIRSTPILLSTLTNKTFTGQVVLTIRNKTPPLTEFNAGNSVATSESTIMTYVQPTSDQRGSTYLSFLQYADSVSGSLDGIYVTGNSGFQQGQAIPASDFVPIDPIVSVTFMKCSSAPCSGTNQRVSINPAMWKESAFSGPILSMLESLAIN
jgi:hypothetical protein